jgi:hypothetical protein
MMSTRTDVKMSHGLRVAPKIALGWATGAPAEAAHFFSIEKLKSYFPANCSRSKEPSPLVAQLEAEGRMRKLGLRRPRAPEREAEAGGRSGADPS